MAVKKRDIIVRIVLSTIMMFSGMALVYFVAFLSPVTWGEYFRLGLAFIGALLALFGLILGIGLREITAKE